MKLNLLSVILIVLLALFVGYYWSGYATAMLHLLLPERHSEPPSQTVVNADTWA